MEVKKQARSAKDRQSEQGGKGMGIMGEKCTYPFVQSISHIAFSRHLALARHFVMSFRHTSRSRRNHTARPRNSKTFD